MIVLISFYSSASSFCGRGRRALRKENETLLPLDNLPALQRLLTFGQRFEVRWAVQSITSAPVAGQTNRRRWRFVFLTRHCAASVFQFCQLLWCVRRPLDVSLAVFHLLADLFLLLTRYFILLFLCSQLIVQLLLRRLIFAVLSVQGDIFMLNTMQPEPRYDRSKLRI